MERCFAVRLNLFFCCYVFPPGGSALFARFRTILYHSKSRWARNQASAGCFYVLIRVFGSGSENKIKIFVLLVGPARIVGGKKREMAYVVNWVDCKCFRKYIKWDFRPFSWARIIETKREMAVFKNQVIAFLDVSNE